MRSYIRSYHFCDLATILNFLVRWDRKIMWFYDSDRDFDNHAPNINLNHLIIPCKPPACSNTTTHHKTNHKHHNYNAYKYWHQVKYYSSHLIKHRHSHLQEMKNTYNISLSHLITPCKPPACSNTTTHHKSNFQHHKYRVLQVFK